MEEKINKLFAIFNDLKNQNLFSLALAQIVSIYNDYPACLYQILRKSNRLLYSRAQDPRLRLEHSQIASAIIERVYRIYNERVALCLRRESPPDNLFHFEPFIDDRLPDMQLENVHDYDSIKVNIRLRTHQIDFPYLIQDEQMILGKDLKYLQRSIENRQRKEPLEDDDDRPDEVLNRLGLSSNFNQANAERIFSYLQGEVDLFEDIARSSEDSELSSDDDAIGNYHHKRKGAPPPPPPPHSNTNTKSQSKKPPKQQPPQIQQYCVINPFNVIYNKAIYSLLNHKWQDRHASALVLKSIVRQKGFPYLGFKYLMSGEKDTLGEKLRDELESFVSNQKNQLEKLQYLLTRCCVVLAMDRFSDYKGNQTHMMVREAACQTAITVLTHEDYQREVWSKHPEEVISFITLMREFLRVNQTCGTYEVSQSALFLIRGLIKDKMHLIHQNFKDILLTVGEKDNEDEVLEQLADIWREFLQLPIDEAYYNKVYLILKKQIDNMDDVSYAGKAIFEFFQMLFLRSVNIKFDVLEDLKLYQKFFFHRIQEVRQAFYSFIPVFIAKISSTISNALEQKLLQYMYIGYQNGLYEENPMIFSSLTLILKECSKLVPRDAMLNFLNHCSLITSDCDPKTKFILFENIHNDLITYYPQLYESNVNSLDQQFYRMAKTAYLLQNIEFSIPDSKQIDPQMFMVLLRNHLKSLPQPQLEIEQSLIGGANFDHLDLQIQINMQNMHQQLQSYLKIEKDQTCLKIIHGFIKVYQEFAVAPAHSPRLRAIYPEILKQLRQLGSLEYEMDSASLQKYQETIMQLVESLQQFNKLSNELLVNCRVLLTTQSEALIQRIKVDKFHVIQDIAAQKLANLLLQNPDCCDIKPLYQKVPQPVSTVSYILMKKGLLKRKDYGRKQLIYLLLSNENAFKLWHLLLERQFTSQIKFFTSDLVVTVCDQADLDIKISTEELRQNVWGIGLIQNVYAYFLEGGGQNQEFTLWIQELLHQISNFAPLIATIAEEDRTKIYFRHQSHATNLLMEFDALLKKQAALSLAAQANNVFSKFIYLISISKSQVFDQTILLINQMIKQNQVIIFEILSTVIKDHPTALSSISGLLTLKTIKKLTSSLPQVQQAASKLLGNLVPILTIQEAIYAPKDEKLKQKVKKGTEFQQGFGKMTKVEYLVEGVLIDQKQVRDYQWDGIRWLGFLTKYNLHAALCDDMGLGKTLQTLTVVANETLRHKKDKPISLVIAPSTVVDHWYAECRKFIHSDILKPHIFNGFFEGNLVLISYNQMLKQNQMIMDQEFFFLILDEAHILKNSKNKSSKTIRSLKAKHKVVLSGTPVQNHLLELWSLFDLLLPNYLGDEEYFKKNFSKAFHTNLFSLTDDEIIFDEQQTKTLKLLHKKVLPFIMRRTKQDVLPQLPAKIIEDYYCTLSPPLQSEIYQILETNSFSNDVEKQLTSTNGEQRVKVQESIFNLLQKMKKALDHPMLVKPAQAVQKRTKKKVKIDTESLVDQKINEKFENIQNPEAYHHSGKMLALKDILQQLGVNSIDDATFPNAEQIQTFTNHNKVLIFSRFRAALQMIQEQLLKTQFPTLQFLVLDGSVPQNQRYALVTKFNEDPDIRVMLLTTQVGGLGLNLSSANIVIMFDHDYNPVNDQQAMDRAHRIGQKNVVQVFRLIVKDTLEEKIMGIQRFKTAISKAIVNSDNASLRQMEKTDLLSMLEHTSQDQKKSDQVDEMEEAQKLTGKYSKILGSLNLDILEELNFDKEY